LSSFKVYNLSWIRSPKWQVFFVYNRFNLSRFCFIVCLFGFLEQALHLQLLQRGNALFIALPHSALAFAVHRVAPQRCPNIFD